MLVSTAGPHPKPVSRNIFLHAAANTTTTTTTAATTTAATTTTTAATGPYYDLVLVVVRNKGVAKNGCRKWSGDL